MTNSTTKNIAIAYNVRRAQEGVERSLRILARAKLHLAQSQVANSDQNKKQAAWLFSWHCVN